MRLLERQYLTNPVVRRASRWSRRVPRTIRRLSSHDGAFKAAPRIIANSVPKSGTHLLTRILAPMVMRDDGTFWISIPARPYREVPRATMLRALVKVVPGELVIELGCERDLSW